MKNNFKFLIVLAILLAGCICVGSTFAAEITVDDVNSIDDVSSVDNVNSIDNTKNMEIAHDDSSQKEDINQLRAGEGNFTELRNLIQNATGDSVYLNKDYCYVEGDGLESIQIRSSLTINGNGHKINAFGFDTPIFFICNLKDNILVDFSNITFVNSSDSAIYFTNNGVVEYCNFINCHSTFDGGAIKFYGDYGIIYTSTFNNCSAKNGGAVYWQKGYSGIGRSIHCSFVNCSAVECGGAIYCGEDNEPGSFHDFNFTNCSAKNGGAIYSQKLIFIYTASFNSCSASDKGGAIYISNTNYCFSSSVTR